MTNCPCRELIAQYYPNHAPLAQPCPAEAMRALLEEIHPLLSGDFYTIDDDTWLRLRDAMLNPPAPDPTPESITESSPNSAIQPPVSQDSAIYPWGNGADLTGGRVKMVDPVSMGREYCGTAIRRQEDGSYTIHWDIGPEAEWFSEHLRPAPFTPAVGQRVRVVSHAASADDDDCFDAGRKDGEVFTIDQFHESGVVSQIGSGIPWIHPADLMLLADQPKAEPTPGDPAFTLPAGFGELPPADTVQGEMAELTAAAKPRKWRRYPEAEQRKMPVGTRLKLRGGPVVEMKANTAYWSNVDRVDGSNLWARDEVAQLQARVIGGAK